MKERVTATNITKSFRGVKALDEISFSVNEGELFGFIGPDGAGKSTLFRILTTVMNADSGDAQVDGFHLKQETEIRSRVGYMPGRFSLYPDLSVQENLEFFAKVFGTTIQENYSSIKEIYVQLEPFKDRRAGKLSGGMKQKLALCCALIHKPRVLFLDEPTTGVDPVSRTEFWEMLARIKNGGLTILVSTPYMDEASRCDRVALIQKGKILDIDTPKGVTEKFPLHVIAVKSEQMQKLRSDVLKIDDTESVYGFGEFLHLTMKKEVSSVEKIETQLRQLGHQQPEVKLIEAGIEDCFMHLMEQAPSTSNPSPEGRENTSEKNL